LIQRATDESAGPAAIYSPKNHHQVYQQHSMPYPSNGRLANQNRFGVFNATDKVVRGGVDFGKLEVGNTIPIPGGSKKSGSQGNGLFLNFSPGQGGTPHVSAPGTATSQRFSS
jgi:hypothetical protein